MTLATALSLFDQPSSQRPWAVDIGRWHAGVNESMPFGAVTIHPVSLADRPPMVVVHPMLLAVVTCLTATPTGIVEPKEIAAFLQWWMTRSHVALM